MATRRVRISLTIDADVDPIAVQVEALGQISRIHPGDDEEIAQAIVDAAATQTVGDVAGSVQVLLFNTSPWRVAEAVPSLRVVPYGVRLSVRAIDGDDVPAA